MLCFHNYSEMTEFYSGPGGQSPEHTTNAQISRSQMSTTRLAAIDARMEGSVIMESVSDLLGGLDLLVRSQLMRNLSGYLHSL
jgi:hypothetical protein